MAPERVFAELKRIVAADAGARGPHLMDRLGVTEVVLPELARLRGIEQSHYHHLDVLDHTRAVLAETIELERDPERVFGSNGAQLAQVLAEPLANELTRGQALRCGALFHDVAKAQTRNVTAEGRVTFIGHDAAGAEIALATLSRLRASERLGAHVAALTRHHLRLGFLVHEMPLSRRAVYRYLKACAPVQVDVTRAERGGPAGHARCEVRAGDHQASRPCPPAASAEALAWRREPPRPPVRGDELVRAAGDQAGTGDRPGARRA